MKLMRRIRRLVKIATFGLFVAAIAQEMAKPEKERTWTGKVFGAVPYDFRPPSWERFQDAYWNPDDERVFTDRPFGVGWAINFYRARQVLTEAFEALMGPAAPPAYKRWEERTTRRTPSRKKAASSD